MHEPRTKHTWVPCLAICAHVISRHCFYQLLEGLLIARMLAFAHCAGHDCGIAIRLNCFLRREKPAQEWYGAVLSLLYYRNIQRSEGFTRAHENRKVVPVIAHNSRWSKGGEVCDGDLNMLHSFAKA